MRFRYRVSTKPKYKDGQILKFGPVLFLRVVRHKWDRTIGCFKYMLASQTPEPVDQAAWFTENEMEDKETK